MDRGACQAAVYAFTKSKTRLSNYYFHCKIKSLIKNKEKKMYRSMETGLPKARGLGVAPAWRDHAEF